MPNGARQDCRAYKADPGRPGHWNTAFASYHSGKAGEDPNVGQNLYVVLGASVTGPADAGAKDPVAFVRWDNLVLLTGERP